MSKDNDRSLAEAIILKEDDMGYLDYIYYLMSALSPLIY